MLVSRMTLVGILAVTAIGGCKSQTESFDSGDGSCNRYELGAMMNSRNGQKAPHDITRQILKAEKDGLEDDRAQHLWTDEDGLFSVVYADINYDGIPDCLVYPAEYLPSLCGAHSISFWIFRCNQDGSHDLVLGGFRADDVEIRGHLTNGYRDIDMLYHAAETETTTFTFDGRQYR